MKKKPKIIQIRPAGAGDYRKRPCSDCPWRVDATGEFPPEAFRLTANTAYDLSQHTFACHQAGPEKSMACAGFLLRGAYHNLAVRFRIAKGEIDPDAVEDGGVELHKNYRAMAVANGVDPDDPVLERCRD